MGGGRSGIGQGGVTLVYRPSLIVLFSLSWRLVRDGLPWSTRVASMLVDAMKHTIQTNMIRATYTPCYVAAAQGRHPSSPAVSALCPLCPVVGGGLGAGADVAAVSAPSPWLKE